MKTYEEPKMDVVEFETPSVMLNIGGSLSDGNNWGPLI